MWILVVKWLKKQKKKIICSHFQICILFHAFNFFFQFIAFTLEDNSNGLLKAQFFVKTMYFLIRILVIHLLCVDFTTIKHACVNNETCYGHCKIKSQCSKVYDWCQSPRPFTMITYFYNINRKSRTTTTFLFTA